MLIGNKEFELKPVLAADIDNRLSEVLKEYSLKYPEVIFVMSRIQKGIPMFCYTVGMSDVPRRSLIRSYTKLVKDLFSVELSNRVYVMGVQAQVIYECLEFPGYIIMKNNNFYTN